MGRFILIFGDLASGKSTLADILSKKYGIPALKKDRLKELLADTVGFTTREENLKLSAATFEIMLHTAESLAAAKKDLILESNFREAELRRINALAEKEGYEILSLYLTADPSLLYERFNKRRTEGRHRAHLTAEFDSFDGFCRYLDGQRAAYIPGKVIRIDASSFDYQKDECLFREIDAFLNHQF